jgi:CBS domain-containing protein
MRVDEIMSTRPVTVRTTTSVRTALRLLSEHLVTTLPVVDERSRILGVVSEVDLLRGRVPPDPAYAVGDDPSASHPALARTVGDLLGRRTVLVHPETDVVEAGRVVGATLLKSLPVVDAADRVVGMVSRSDIVRALARDDDVLQQEIADAMARAGLGGWHVEVRNGVARLWATRPVGDGARDRRDTAARIAEATPGIARVSVSEERRDTA